MPAHRRSGGDGVSERVPRDEADRTHLVPTEAFGLLAHDTRMAALQVLWEAGEPLRFSEIADRADISDTGNFNYHLGELVGHFVRKVGEQYALTRSGRQAMTAVLAGDITERHTLGPARIDAPCPYCGADVLLSHEADDLRVLCSSCEGTFRGKRATKDTRQPSPAGTITTLPFPPGGIRDRELVGVLEAALTRMVSRNQQIANGVCPDCGGLVELTLTACPEHDDEGVCEACGSRFAGLRVFSCRTCGRTQGGLLALLVLVDPVFHAYFSERGFDFLNPTWREVVAALNMDERVHQVDPLEYEAIWVVDGETLSMHVDGEREAVDLARDDRS